MDYSLAFFTGEAMTKTNAQRLTKKVLPGETIDLSVDMIAPTKPGKHTGYWGLKNPAGVWVPVIQGHNDMTFYVEIFVER